MRVFRSKVFTASRAWGAEDILLEMEPPFPFIGPTSRTINMYAMEKGSSWFSTEWSICTTGSGIEHVVTSRVGDVFYAEVGCEHVAHPRGGLGFRSSNVRAFLK